MATPNIVPRADSEGQLGTLSKYWAAAYIDLIYVGAGKIGRDADNNIDFSTDNTTSFVVNGNSELKLDASQLYPTTSDGLTLGHSSYHWSDLFLASGAVINFDNGNVALTHSSGALTSSGHIVINDSKRLKFGGGHDLEIYHDTSNSYITQQGTGDLIIQQTTDNKDIIFQSDDGSGNLATYFFLDGSTGNTIFPDGKKLTFGSSNDMFIEHDGSNSYISNSVGTFYIRQTLDDGDLVLTCDDGSGGNTPYITLDGGVSRVLLHKSTRIENNIPLQFGTGGDAFIRWNSNFEINNETGSDLIITNSVDDKDIIFKSDDGAGGVANYFSLDGSSATHDGTNTTALYTSWPDNSYISLGTSHDLKIVHTGVNSLIQNLVGKLQILSFADDIEIKQFGNDKDIVFQSDDGNGGTATYFSLDGGEATYDASTSATTALFTIFPDKSRAAFGTGKDLQIYHDGTDSYIDEVGTGDLIISADNDLKFMDRGNNIMANMNAANSVELYFAGNKKLETTAGGVTITGNVGVGITAASKLHIYENNTATGGEVGLTVEQDGTGDAVVQYLLTDTRRWVTGIDNSNSDAFTIASSGDLGSDGVLTLGTSGAATFAGKVITTELESASTLLLDAAADITIDAGGGDIILSDDTTVFGTISSSGGMQIRSRVDNADMFLRGVDNGTEFTALTLDMSENGNATFAGTVTGTSFNGIPFFTDVPNQSMYTHDVSATDVNAAQNSAYGFLALSNVTTGDNNTAMGYLAGRFITTGVENTLIGSLAGDALTTGNYNVALGYNALSTEDEHSANTAIGFSSLAVLNAGAHGYNTAVGYESGKSMTTGTHNTLIGASAGDALTSGAGNVAVGYNALTTEDANGTATAIGYRALATQNAGAESYNVAVGYDAGLNVTTGVQNTIIGGLAGDAITEGGFNVAIGYGALSSEDTTGRNVAIGYHALTSQNAGSDAYNVAVGFKAGEAMTTAIKNTLIGGSAGDAITEGGFNVAIGYDALSANTVGNSNIAIGTAALATNVAADRNVAIGTDALTAMTSATTLDTFNTAVGFNAGLAVTSGVANTIMGGLAGDALTTGTHNVAIGYSALTTEDAHGKNVAVGYETLAILNAGADALNTAVGYQAGAAVTTGVQNTLIGYQAGDSFTSGSHNTAIGVGALSTEDAHGRNTAIGHQTLATQNAGADAYNVAVGYQAGLAVTTGTQNTVVGGSAGDAITSGTRNVALGYNALSTEDTGSRNVAIGWHALGTLNHDGNGNNTALGYYAGALIQSGFNNTIIGSLAGDALTTGSNNILIGKNAAASAVDVDNETVIGTPTTLDAIVHGLKQPVKPATANIAASASSPNTIYLFGDADGAVVTLPDSGDGTQVGKSYEFVVTVTATDNAHKVVFTDTTNEKLYGQLHMVDTDSSDAQVTFAAQAGDSFSAVSLNGTTTGIIGSRFKITNVAADFWVVEGNIHHTGDVATPFATS